MFRERERERQGEMGLEDLGDLVLSIILSKVGPKNAAMIACVSRRYRVSASDEGLWLRFCSEELDLSSPEDPYGKPAPSFKVTYKLWKEAFGMYPWPLVRRAKQCWSTLKSWMAANFPEAGNTLRKGASEAEIKVLENELGVTLPLPTRVLYRFCDGQEIGGPEEFLGLIGGYFFYDHAVNVYLLPLSGVIFETKELRHGGFPSTSKYVVVAASTYMDKLFILNCDDGQLYVGTGNLATNREMIPCVPDALIRSVHDMNSFQLQDAILLWLEEHGRRLQSGTIRLREERKIRSISLFPETSPVCSIAVTNGVQVRASAVFVPELSNLQNEEEKYCFSYSIRMRLLPQGCMLDGVYFGSCQLYWRHWVIRANDVVVSTAGGDAVIGKHPLLYPGAEEFVYESCSPMRSSSGSIEGAFTFVPGRMLWSFIDQIPFS
ncbi:F-box protein SKIP16 isoform X2 [Magnolia sinica]|uniref:F-box protein SKIP16 isoform X2 n=1 Tax=Magnolia sinica TaxID=86752 RepID=UPI002658CA20|nr:F-box protein SKIP16 isoform X2 [Magnolia sinica]